MSERKNSLMGPTDDEASLVMNASAATSIQQQQATTTMATAMTIHLTVLLPFLAVVSGAHVAGGIEPESLNCDISGRRVSAGAARGSGVSALAQTSLVGQ